MTWTSDKPTVEGWYWYRENEMEAPSPTMMRSKKGRLQTLVGEFWCDIISADGQWSSEPISPPTE